MTVWVQNLININWIAISIIECKYNELNQIKINNEIDVNLNKYNFLTLNKIDDQAKYNLH